MTDRMVNEGSPVTPDPEDLENTPERDQEKEHKFRRILDPKGLYKRIDPRYRPNKGVPNREVDPQ